MKNYIIPEASLISEDGSSDGTQKKYFYDGKWFKQNQMGYEGLAEFLASCVLDCSNVEDFVAYEECLINNKKGCVSANFLGESEVFYSFDRIHQMYTGARFLDHTMVLPDVSSRIKYVVEFMMDKIGVDCQKYLSDIFSLDAFTLNHDRHFHNLGVVYDTKKNYYRSAPIFDNGAGFLSYTGRYPMNCSIEKNINDVIGQPLCANLQLQAYYAGISLRLDYELLTKSYIEVLPPSRGLEVLKYQVEHCSKLIPEFHKEIVKDR
ncbi:MAG: hypothetical protein Q4C61_12700 [Lachnospiraceae bacterium]|nr:hypothetical protein [Lachnospiraceae bacterium]